MNNKVSRSKQHKALWDLRARSYGEKLRGSYRLRVKRRMRNTVDIHRVKRHLPADGGEGGSPLHTHSWANIGLKAVGGRLENLNVSLNSTSYLILLILNFGPDRTVNRKIASVAVV